MVGCRGTLLVLLLAVLLFAMGCAPRITIDATPNPQFAGPLSPVTFVVFEGNTDSAYTVPLREGLNAELARRSLVGSAQLISGLELNEGQILNFWASRSKAIVIIAPAGGAESHGSLERIVYDVRVYHMVNPRDGVIVWRARATTEGGIDLAQRYQAFADSLLARLIADRVLPSQATVAPSRPRAPKGTSQPAAPSRHSGEPGP